MTEPAALRPIKLRRLDEHGNPVGPTQDLLATVNDMAITYRERACAPQPEPYLVASTVEFTVPMSNISIGMVPFLLGRTEFSTWRVDFNHLVAPRLTRLLRWVEHRPWRWWR